MRVWLSQVTHYHHGAPTEHLYNVPDNSQQHHHNNNNSQQHHNNNSNNRQQHHTYPGDPPTDRWTDNKTKFTEDNFNFRVSNSDLALGKFPT